MTKSAEILEQRRRQSKIDLENKISEVRSKIPNLAEVLDNIRSKQFELLSFSSDIDEESLEKEISILQQKRDELLTSNGYPLDYLSIKHFCNFCKDTGYVGTKKCDCKTKLQIEEKYEMSHLKKKLEVENFENFDFEVFRKQRMSSEEISPYENMKQIHSYLYDYAKDFDTDSHSLYIFGPVGTGKTYLLNCIAKEVLDLGKSVVYLSEANLVNDILEYRFAFSDRKGELKSKIDSLLNSDLIIIDDLGANNINDATISALFEVIDYRRVRELPVIISSNLDTDDLGRKYDARIFSRIFGEYFSYKLFGNDIRMR